MSNPSNWLFENVTCTRCGGTGRFSRCQTMRGPYGQETCFKCSGKHNMLTKRGVICQEMFTRSLSKPAWEIQPGDFIKPRGCSSFIEVTESYLKDTITSYSNIPNEEGLYANHYHWVLACEKASYTMHTTPRDVIRVGWTPEQKQPIVDLCLEYQSLLTKAGKPMKKHAERCAQIEALLPDPRTVECPYESTVLLTKDEMIARGVREESLK